MCLSGSLCTSNSGSPETEDNLIKLKSLVQLVVVKLKYKFLHLKKKRKLNYSLTLRLAVCQLLPWIMVLSLLSSRILTCTLPGVGLLGWILYWEAFWHHYPLKALSFCYQMHFPQCHYHCL